MTNVVAVIGCGRIARGAHFPALSKIEGVRVKYACDIIEEKALTMKEKHPIIENVITDYKVALSDPEVDSVFVLTPNCMHYPITMDALKAGKNVLCEKPATINYALSKKMLNQAKKSGKKLCVGVCNRYNNAVELLKEKIDNGDFGNIYQIYLSFRAFRSIPGLGGAFTDKSKSGGGVLMDWGVHYVDIACYLLGDVKVKTISCNTYNQIAKDMKSYKYTGMWAEDTKDVENGVNDVDDFITGFIRTNKAGITLNGAWAQNVNKPESFIDILGDKGGARLYYGDNFDFFDGQTLETTNSNLEIVNPWLVEDKAFFEGINNKTKCKNEMSDVMETMKILDGLYTSDKKQKEIKF